MSPPARNAQDIAPRRRLTAARRRRQLFDVAVETFAASGFDSTTMEEIASAAGVTKPLLYQHFASKRALYLELIDDVSSRLLKALDEAASGETNGWRRVLAGMQAYFLFVLDNQSAMRLLFDAPQDEELARGLHALEDAIASFVAPLVEADIDDNHRRVAAAGVVGMTEGITRAWLSSRQAERQADGRPDDHPDPSTLPFPTPALATTGAGSRPPAGDRSYHVGGPGSDTIRGAGSGIGAGARGEPSSGPAAGTADEEQQVLRLAHRAAELAWGGLRSLRRDT